MPRTAEPARHTKGPSAVFAFGFLVVLGALAYLAFAFPGVLSAPFGPTLPKGLPDPMAQRMGGLFHPLRRKNGMLNLPPPRPGWTRRGRVSRHDGIVTTSVFDVPPAGPTRHIGLGRIEPNEPKFFLDRWIQDQKDRQTEAALRRGDPRRTWKGVYTLRWPRPALPRTP